MNLNFRPYTKIYFQDPLTLNLALELIKFLKQKRNRLRSIPDIPPLCTKFQSGTICIKFWSGSDNFKSLFGAD